MFAVLTGAPHVGKSTLIKMLAKMGHSVMSEVAEEVINEGVHKPWLGDAEQLAFQAEVANRQKQAETRLNTARGIAYLDRGLVDAIAYRLVYGRSLTDLHFDMSARHYAVAFVLDPLDGWEDNGVRYEDPDFSRAITPVIKRVYESFGVPVVTVPTMQKVERLRLIGNYLRDLVADHVRAFEDASSYVQTARTAFAA
jgi:predicted ATPase